MSFFENVAAAKVLFSQLKKLKVEDRIFQCGFADASNSPEVANALTGIAGIVLSNLGRLTGINIGSNEPFAANDILEFFKDMEESLGYFEKVEVKWTNIGKASS